MPYYILDDVYDDGAFEANEARLIRLSNDISPDELDDWDTPPVEMDDSDYWADIDEDDDQDWQEVALSRFSDREVINHRAYCGRGL